MASPTASPGGRRAGAGRAGAGAGLLAALVLAAAPAAALPAVSPGGSADAGAPGRSADAEGITGIPAAEPEPSGLRDGSVETAQQGQGGQALTGVLEVTAGACEEEGVTEGSYFRMIQPNGDAEDGPFVENSDSPCGDQTYTPLAPGTDGGLRLGDYQPHPDEAFDVAGNGVADAIFEPQAFFGVDFAVATNAVDPQTEQETVPPELVHDGAGGLSGDLRAVGVAWNRQHFNQGAPKPSGEEPGRTEGPQGSYDPDTGATTLTWTSEIEGGPFDGFTGLWHLEGTAAQEPSSEPTPAPEPEPQEGGEPSEPAAGPSPTAPATSEQEGAPLADTGGGPGWLAAALLALGAAGLAAVRRDATRGHG